MALKPKAKNVRFVARKHWFIRKDACFARIVGHQNAVNLNMNIIFNINYRTRVNQKLYVVGSIPELGEWQAAKAKEMAGDGDGNWTVSIETSTRKIAYQYLVIGNGETIHEPWKRKHTVKLESSLPVCYLYDYWQLVPSEVSLYSSAFTKNVFARHGSKQHSEKVDRQLIIRVFCPRVEKNQSLFISGNQSVLGDWNTKFALKMSCPDFPEWEIRLNIDTITFPLEYKFIIADKTGRFCQWETGENRLLSSLPNDNKATFIISEYPYRDSRPMWKGVGTVIPVFSLRSEQSFGIGDFRDLRLLIDWAKQTNQRLIQVLPMNDTTATYLSTDSYPYSAISIYALNPVYISLSDLGELKNEKMASLFRKRQKCYNKQKTIWYDCIRKNKERYCRAFFEQEKEQILQSKAFQSFCKQNKTWLEPYALFCFLRDKYKTADFTRWGNKANYDPLMLQSLLAKSIVAMREIPFIYFMQFVLHTQFKDVAEYARKKGVILKGDLPIGISRTSVEAWIEPAYFNLDMQSGAPPDFFSTTGQNWSFPTYNWEVMEKDGYTWWKKRFSKISDYFDCLRIDHILGFFRIWEIPLNHVQGLCGHFSPALPLSIDEIGRFGFRFDQRFVKPRIHPRFLIKLFEDITEDVIEKYLEPDEDGFMVLRPFCDTQRKIDRAFQHRDQNGWYAAQHTDDHSLLIKKGLYHIINEALFVEDPYEKHTYHPRIMASQSYAFQELTEKEQIAYQNLSNEFFYERHNNFWKSVSLKRLTPLVESTDMLICGEDLGMIPKSVQEVMDELHILSLELERAPKMNEIDFTNLQSVPCLSVCTTSTHDMEPLRGWWKEDMQKTKHYFETVLRRVGKIPLDCSTDIAEQIIMNHLNAPSMLTIIPLQDWFAMNDTLKRTDKESERINIPENPKHYWNYRIHISLEQLLQANELNQKICEMIETSGR